MYCNSAYCFKQNRVLKYIYRFGNIAFIGGGFEKGILQYKRGGSVWNTLRLLDLITINLLEVFSLIKEGFVFPINSYEQFEQQLLNVYNNNLFQQKYAYKPFNIFLVHYTRQTEFYQKF